MALAAPRIILLKEGTDTSQGKAQLVSNINACEAIFDILKGTLGPRVRVFFDLNSLSLYAFFCRAKIS